MRGLVEAVVNSNYGCYVVFYLVTPAAPGVGRGDVMVFDFESDGCGGINISQMS